MKGIVFTEFLDMVDDVFSPTLTEEIILACDLPSKGVYTATGTYDHQELLQMVVELGRRTETPVSQLVNAFGHHLFRVFAQSFPVKIEAKQELFDFLKSVENYIHVEVKKLYPDAALPSIECSMTDRNEMELTYRSACPFADLAQGLIEESAEHFNTKVDICRPAQSKDGSQATFRIKKVS